MKINWKYAIGEILIVIIGISIAYGLNNWSANQANAKQKRQYLDNLVMDIEEEIKQLEENQLAIQGKINDIQIVMPFLGQKQTKRDSIVSKVFALAQQVNFSPENTTYQTLINSGDMKLLNRFELRRQIEEHYALHKVVLKNYERIELIHKNYLGDFFIHQLDYQKLAKGNQDFLDKPLLRNIITSIQGAYYLVLRANKQCLESNRKLLNTIKTEL